MKPKSKKEDHLGPISPFTLGSVFIEAATKLAWIEEEQEERQRRYFITSKGFEEMAKLGMDLEKVLHQYRPLASSPEGQAPARPHRHRHPRRH
ncbi:MAG TPA: hypothetical protein VMV34_03200 [Terriglobia bacterium]|nr:hypothetical protein [Terriglobia bacterium]